MVSLPSLAQGSAEPQAHLIGNLGYAGHRKPAETQVLALDVHTLAVGALAVTGTPPGWIHKHEARLADGGGAIIVSRGLREPEGDGPLVENIDDWRLDLEALRWERLTTRQWPCFEVTQEDGERNLLWDVQNVKWNIDNQFGKWENARDALVNKLGGMPDFPVCDVLYAPPVAFTPLPERDGDEFSTTRIEVDGVVVRYVAGSYSIRLIVEGELAPDKVETIVRDLREKLAKLVLRPWVARRL